MSLMLVIGMSKHSCGHYRSLTCQDIGLNKGRFVLYKLTLNRGTQESSIFYKKKSLLLPVSSHLVLKYSLLLGGLHVWNTPQADCCAS